jgi:hypothetical protein
MSSRSVELSIRARQLMEHSLVLIRDSDALVDKCHAIRAALAAFRILQLKDQDTTGQAR